MAKDTQVSASAVAPYGQACMQCSKAKCKCMVSTPGQSCERCLRLNKECTPSLTIRKHKPRRPNTSRTAKLEEKLDGLMSILEAPTSTLRPNLSQIPDTSTTLFAASHPKTNTLAQNCTSNVITTPPASLYGTNTSPSMSVPSNWEPGPLEAEQFLNVFRSRKCPRFSFVYIPPEKSAAQLQTERPFLWTCIMYTSLSNYEQSVEAGLKIRQILCQRMIMEFDKDLDLLQGLLAYIAWVNPSMREKPTLAVLTQLAMSVVFDLGLNRHIPTDASALHNCIKQGGLPISLNRTMEERRAVLSCFVISSV